MVDLLSGDWPASSIILPTVNSSKCSNTNDSIVKTKFQPGHVRTNSLKLSHELAASLTANLTYQAHDFSDISSKGKFYQILYS